MDESIDADFRPGPRRVKAVVIGPAAPGFLKVDFGTFDADVSVTRIPPQLRLPNSHFVALVQRRQMLHVEVDGTWLLEQEQRIREVLNEAWDPIGVAVEVPDEYDGYISVLRSLLSQCVGADRIARHLLRIEIDSMGLEESSDEVRLNVARRLLALDLPALK